MANASDLFGGTGGGGIRFLTWDIPAETALSHGTPTIYSGCTLSGVTVSGWSGTTVTVDVAAPFDIAGLYDAAFVSSDTNGSGVMRAKLIAPTILIPDSSGDGEMMTLFTQAGVTVADAIAFVIDPGSGAPGDLFWFRTELGRSPGGLIPGTANIRDVHYALAGATGVTDYGDDPGFGVSAGGEIHHVFNPLARTYEVLVGGVSQGSGTLPDSFAVHDWTMHVLTYARTGELSLVTGLAVNFYEAGSSSTLPALAAPGDILQVVGSGDYLGSTYFLGQHAQVRADGDNLIVLAPETIGNVGSNWVRIPDPNVEPYPDWYLGRPGYQIQAATPYVFFTGKSNGDGFIRFILPATTPGEPMAVLIVDINGVMGTGFPVAYSIKASGTDTIEGSPQFQTPEPVAGRPSVLRCLYDPDNSNWEVALEQDTATTGITSLPENRLIPAGGAGNLVLKKNTSADFDVSWQADNDTIGGGPTTFLGLTDTPSSYGGTKGRHVVSTGSGLILDPEILVSHRSYMIRSHDLIPTSTLDTKIGDWYLVEGDITLETNGVDSSVRGLYATIQPRVFSTIPNSRLSVLPTDTSRYLDGGFTKKYAFTLDHSCIGAECSFSIVPAAKVGGKEWGVWAANPVGSAPVPDAFRALVNNGSSIAWVKPNGFFTRTVYSLSAFTFTEGNFRIELVLDSSNANYTLFINETSVFSESVPVGSSTFSETPICVAVAANKRTGGSAVWNLNLCFTEYINKYYPTI